MVQLQSEAKNGADVGPHATFVITTPHCCFMCIITCTIGLTSTFDYIRMATQMMRMWFGMVPEHVVELGSRQPVPGASIGENPIY